MGNEAWATESIFCLLEMVEGKCGHLRQPGVQRLEEEWVEAGQGTRNGGGGTRQGMVQGDEEENMG